MKTNVSIRSKKLKRSVLGVMFSLFVVSSASHSLELSNQDQYFEGLKALCGARFEGAMTFPKDGQDSFAGKLLVANFDQCDENQLRVPFVVGKDSSRTWIFSRIEGGLQLKHDHRHPDGTPDEVNMYGGMANDSGTSLSQSFEADQHTAEVIPAASTNVWTVSLNPSGNELSYHLERNAAQRFTAVLKRVGSQKNN
ncbi:MAG: hypothetical protein ACI9LY_002430 [Arenicella sp.]|jgi:hypothetical protein